MSDWKAKRFWKAAGVVAAGEGFAVELDGRPIRTPAKNPLTMPTRAMAEAVASEWMAQDGVIDPRTMPATRTVNAAVDKVAPQHAEVAEMLAAYGDADLLCYRAEGPEELVARQQAQWDPYLDWARRELAVDLSPRTGIMHAPQGADALATLSQRTHALNDFELAAFHDLVSLSGSLVLGFAAALDAGKAEEIWTVSRLDELWQIEQWGADEEAEALAEVKRQSFLHAKQMFDLAKKDG
ncbi:MAG: ATPase [Rhodobacteraceae bacterium]|nr:ATPase [Paracoccaceae bacterium]